MTDAELIARLREYREINEGSTGVSYDPIPECLAAADRIEQLVATNEALSISNATLIAERDQWIAHAKNAIWSDSEQLRLAEAKLAALVDAAEKVINSYWHSTDGVITGIYDLEAALAEIKKPIAEWPEETGNIMVGKLKGESHE